MSYTMIIDCKDKHCIIGAGTSGLAQARAFLALDLPFDVFEQHKDIGGLWDIENTGTPVYENTHLISSRKGAVFLGFPFPPGADFPRCDEVFSYLHSFGDAYDLKKYIYFSSEVEKVEPKDGC